ncbi:hypothetical protein KL942_001373 [Ogataea angusta]|uniref:Carboxymuconolactone decarboxylase-like domain-containing protein n=1 Tax=Pichia angusta TaxID=870730 RepID=A0ABQ7S191_PICAN|nr:hypothetical protein KL920_002039 [Ogataea angusta]KAG7841494.1 hypothetical protein KL942_001373 [Ogataea angusta]KAG7850929.1 hypothetical protein KL940_001506 [Ogataea angusta]
MILTPQRLIQLSNAPRLGNMWYLIATVTLTVCNQPQEIPKLYHYALHVKHGLGKPSEELYHRVAQTIESVSADINSCPYEIESGLRLSDKFRESILKTAALSGLPKAINSLMILRETTPKPLRATADVKRHAIESFADYEAEQARGMKFWKTIYSKISGRVINQMSSSYPDLWTYTIQHVYSPLLSFSDVLTPQETSMIVISCLIPQDVNPQLKGHLKGALNLGLDLETVRECREMAIEISKWCGMVWKTEVAKL